MPKDKVILSGGSLVLDWLTIDAYDVYAPNLVRMWIEVAGGPIQEIKDSPPAGKRYHEVLSLGLTPYPRIHNGEIAHGIAFSVSAKLTEHDHSVSYDGWTLSLGASAAVMHQLGKMESAELFVKERYASGSQYHEVVPDEVAKLYFSYLIAAAKKTLLLYARATSRVPA